jgi:serine protease SohB
VVEFLAEYGLFLLKALTIVAAIVVIIGVAVSAGSRGQRTEHGNIEVQHLNERFDDMAQALKEVVLDPIAIKQQLKQKKKADKKAQAAKKKASKRQPDDADARRKIFVLDFDGDLRASAVAELREEISAVLTIATPKDEVVVKLESGGGMVHSYGLASSQLDRLREKQVPLTVCVDKVAASGGYMMACIGNKIIAAPFAMLGSVGVVAQIPNFHRVLKKHDVDFEMMTAGEYKRTLTMFGENTDKGREKFAEELEETHALFKEFVAEHRPSVDIDAIATGEVWFGTKALEVNLVDQLGTSDQYLMDLRDSADIYHIRYTAKKTLQERLGLAAQGALTTVFERAWQGVQQSRFFS